MKSFSKLGSLVFAVLAILWLTGCGQTSNPVSTLSSQPGSSGAGTTSAIVKSQDLLPGQSVNCTQTCSSPSASLGGTVTYTVNLSVSGSACSNVQIQDVLPAGMSYVQGSATTLAGGTFNCTGSTLTWVYNSVGPCTCTMTYVAQVNNLLGLLGSTLENTAVLTCTGLTAPISATVGLLVSALNTSTPTSTFTAAPPTATRTFTSVPPTATFTCVPPTATFTPVPPTATFTFTSTNSFTPTNTFTVTNSFTPTNTFTWTPTSTNTPVPPTPTHTFTATNSFTPVPPTATPTFTAIPPTATMTYTPIPLPAISLSQAASSLTCLLGGQVTYTINLAVSGAAAANAQVQDVLPVGMSYVQGTATTIQGGTFTCTGSTLTWVYNSVGPCSCTMTYVAQVNNVVGLIGSTLPNTAVMTCPCMQSPLSATTNVQVLGSLLGGLGL